jgi:transposase
MGPRGQYPSDVSREQFERVRPLREGVRKLTKPRTVDLYEVFNAVLYLLKSGCQWRMLPDRFPKWRTVHSYFANWSELGSYKGAMSRRRFCSLDGGGYRRIA